MSHFTVLETATCFTLFLLLKITLFNFVQYEVASLNLGHFLFDGPAHILRTIFDNIWERTYSLYLLTKNLTTTSRNNFQQDVKIKELITIIVLHHYFLIRDVYFAKYFPMIFL